MICIFRKIKIPDLRLRQISAIPVVQVDDLSKTSEAVVSASQQDGSGKGASHLQVTVLKGCMSRPSSGRIRELLRTFGQFYSAARLLPVVAHLILLLQLSLSALNSQQMKARKQVISAVVRVNEEEGRGRLDD